MSAETTRILVIEDNEDNITLIDYLLRAGGYDPALARNGEIGLAEARANVPDLILLDIRMPGIDGYDVARALKDDPAFELTKIVAVTASAMVGDRERITEAGFDGYIQKPINPEMFLSQIKQWLPSARSGS